MPTASLKDADLYEPRAPFIQTPAEDLDLLYEPRAPFTQIPTEDIDPGLDSDEPIGASFTQAHPPPTSHTAKRKACDDSPVPGTEDEDSDVVMESTEDPIMDFDDDEPQANLVQVVANPAEPVAKWQHGILQDEREAKTMRMTSLVSSLMRTLQSY